jgi:hypothetical protein
LKQQINRSRTKEKPYTSNSGACGPHSGAAFRLNRVRGMITQERLTLIDPLDDSRWDPFVSAHRYGSIYQHSSWLKVINCTYRHVQPMAVVLEDRKSDLMAGLPFCVVHSRVMGNRIVSLPFTSYCDPLISREGDLSRLLDGAIDQVKSTGSCDNGGSDRPLQAQSPWGHPLNNRSAHYFELRVFRSKDEILDPRLKMNSYHKLHLLDLRPGLESLRRAFHKDCIRKSIRKATRSGITVRVAASERDLKKYYLIHGRTRKRLGLPIQPYSLFRNMWEIMVPLGSFGLLLAELNGEIIGGLILFKFRDTVTLEHIGSNDEHLLLRPNHILYAKAIEMACAEGYLYADFGKTSPENQGLLDFKRRWGAVMYDAPYFYYPEVRGIMSLNEKNALYRTLVSVGKHIPFSVSRALGSMVYRHMG